MMPLPPLSLSGSASSGVGGGDTIPQRQETTSGAWYLNTGGSTSAAPPNYLIYGLLAVAAWYFIAQRKKG